MSFVTDQPLIFLSGIIIFFPGQRLEWNRHAKIVVGMAILPIFIIFSDLLRLDIFGSIFPFFAGMSGLEFMQHDNIASIYRSQVPAMIAVILFILYPFCHREYGGQARAHGCLGSLTLDEAFREWVSSLLVTSVLPAAPGAVRLPGLALGSSLPGGSDRLHCALRAVNARGYAQPGPPDRNRPRFLRGEHLFPNAKKWS